MINEAARARLHQNYPVFEQLPDTLQEQLSEESRLVKVPAGRTIFEIGAPCQTYPLLLTGVVRVFKPSETGREILLYRLQPGQSCIVTTSCLLGNMPFMACGVAENSLQSLVVPKHLFNLLINQSDPFRSFVFEFFGQRIAQLMMLIEEIAFKKLDQRLATLLLEQGPTIQSTHQQLAGDLGSVREVVSRLLQDFKEEGAIELERGRIEIVDADYLQQLSRA